jgi:hypothetical protein
MKDYIGYIAGAAVLIYLIKKKRLNADAGKCKCADELDTLDIEVETNGGAYKQPAPPPPATGSTPGQTQQQQQQQQPNVVTIIAPDGTEYQQSIGI